MALWGLVGLAVAAVSTAKSIEQQKKSAQFQRKAAEAQSQRQEIEDAKERRRIVAETRRKRARIVAASVERGIGGSSAEAGAAGALETGASSALGSSDTQSFLSNRQSQFAQQAINASSKAQTFQAYGQLALTIGQGIDDAGASLAAGAGGGFEGQAKGLGISKSDLQGAF